MSVLTGEDTQVRCAGAVTRLLLPLMLLLAGAVPAAQSPPDALLAIDVRGQPRPIARWTAGQWIAVAPERTCDVPPVPLRHTGDLLVAPDIRVDTPRRLDVPLPDALTVVVRRVFRERESEQRLSSANLSTVPMTLDVVHAAREADGSTLYYVEASKRLEDATPPAPPGDEEVDPRGVLRITVSGWLRATGARVTTVATRGELHWEQLEEDGTVPRRSTLEPVGIVRAGPLPVWVMRAAAGTIALYEIGPTHARAIVTAPVRAC